MSVEVNYIYLLQEREFLKTNETIYKIGKTTQMNYDRFKQYPNGSVLLYQTICDNCHTLEKELLSIFKNKFKHRKDIGNEYFEGNYKDMIDIISNKSLSKNTKSFEKTTISELKVTKPTEIKSPKKSPKKKIEKASINNTVDISNNISTSIFIFSSSFNTYDNTFFEKYVPVVIGYDEDDYCLFNSHYAEIGFDKMSINKYNFKNYVWIKDTTHIKKDECIWDNEYRFKSYVWYYNRLYDDLKLILKQSLNLTSVVLV